MSLRLSKLIATAFGTGYVPMAPGTAGSIIGMIFLYVFNLVLMQLFELDIYIVYSGIVLIIFTFYIGGFAIKKVHEEWKHDSGKIVIDEVIGVFITLFASPLDWRYYLTGLVLFRVFDIWKPLYIRKIDNMNSNWSVMLDDVLAGVYSFILLRLMILYFPII
jgi:phosphatidylglycerophosphatase A